MMNLALLGGYLAASFLLAALFVRLLPRSIAAQHLGERLWMFPALPLFAVLDAMRISGDALALTNRGAIALFEKISGKPHRSRSNRRCGYFAYGRNTGELRRRASDTRVAARQRPASQRLTG